MAYCTRYLYIFIKESDFKKVDLAKYHSFSLCNAENQDIKIKPNYPDPIETYLKSEKQV